MKFFANKNIWKKFVIAFLIIWSVTFVAPKRVSAVTFGGTLLSPVVALFVTIADATNDIIQSLFIKQDTTIIHVAVGTKWYQKIGLSVWGTIKTGGGVFNPVGIAIRSVKTGYNVIAKNDKLTKKTVFTTVTGISGSVLETADEVNLPLINLSPYEIFANSDGIFSVNIFEDQKDDTIISKMRTIVAGWYNTLRLIAIISMMSVLVYIGIRIVLSSANESKAKYKQMLWDWMVAMALLFVMQYIMVFANVLVDSFTDIIDAVKVEVDVDNESGSEQVYTHNGVQGFLIGATGSIKENNLKVDPDSKLLVEKAYETLVKDEELNFSNEDMQNMFWSDIDGTPAKDKEDAKVLFWPTDNFTAQARMLLQVAKQADGKQSNYQYVGYTIIYIALTVYTVIFIFVYVRRLIYMVFLTLISPFVALTYPIDKAGDGQAQAFNYWFKEYVYNLMLQPLHLLIYMILIGMAMQFAISNPIYVIVCLGFMVPAEKLLKQMFGFKGNTPGAIPGMAAGAFLGNLANKAIKGGGDKPKSGGGSNGGSGEDSGNNPQLRTSSSRNPWENPNLLGSNNGNGGGRGDGNPNPNPNPNSEGDTDLDETGQRWNDWATDQDNYYNNGNSGSGGEGSTNSQTQNTPLDNPQEENEAGNTSPASGDRQNQPIRRENQQRIPNRNRSILGSALRATAKKPINGFKRTIGNERWWAGKARNVGKGAVRLGATTIRTVPSAALAIGAGTAVGMFSGDFGKGAGTATAVLGFGYANARQFGNRVAANSFNGEWMDEFKNDYYTKEELDEQDTRKYINEWKLKEENLKVLSRNRISNEQYDEMVKEGGIEQYLRNGITDAKQMAIAEQLYDQQRRENPNYSRLDAIDMLNARNKTADGKYHKLNKEEQERWDKTMAESFAKAGVAQDQIPTRIEGAKNLFKTIDKIEKNLR